MHGAHLQQPWMWPIVIGHLSDSADVYHLTIPISWVTPSPYRILEQAIYKLDSNFTNKYNCIEHFKSHVIEIKVDML